MQLTGIHHLTAITANASTNYDFYTRVLGLRLVKKTVNQDDVSAYHLFYADGRGTPGSDITFFDWPAQPVVHGRGSISRTALRVPASSLGWWRERFLEEGVEHGGVALRAGREVLDFLDGEGQRLTLVADQADDDGHVWGRSVVPTEHQILGLGRITLTLGELAPTERVLGEVLNMHRIGSFADARQQDVETHVFAMGEGGAAAELHLEIAPNLKSARQGAGGVHHVAFRVPDEMYEAWAARLVECGMPSSGPVDRFYFRSLYFREAGWRSVRACDRRPGIRSGRATRSPGPELVAAAFSRRETCRDRGGVEADHLIAIRCCNPERHR